MTLSTRIRTTMKTRRAITVTAVIVVLLAAAAAAVWHFVWLKPYTITPDELQDRYAHRPAFTPGPSHAVDIRLQSFDGEFITGRIVYPGNPARASQPFPVLIGLHAMGRSHLRWWHPDVKGRPTIEQTHLITQMALQRGHAVVAIDARAHGQRRVPGQPHAAQQAMRAMHWLGRRQAYEQMVVDTVRDHRVLLDWLATQPQLDASRVAVAGYSMGAQGALLLAALDDRVQAVAAMVPPGLGANVAAVAPITLAGSLQTQRVWLLTANDDEHASPEQNQALFDAIASPDKKHLRFESGHRLPAGYVEALAGWFGS